MPTVQPGETQAQFMTRCIPKVIEDGTAKNPHQAIAICLSMWAQEQKISWFSLLFDQDKENHQENPPM